MAFASSQPNRGDDMRLSSLHMLCFGSGHVVECRTLTRTMVEIKETREMAGTLLFS